MNIDNIENEVESKIISRGISYFEMGAIDELWQEPNGEYHAVVDGTEPYEVMVRIDNCGEIMDHSCDCPYDWGEYCKHEVAVMLAVRDAKEKQASLPSKRQKKQRSIKALLSKYKKTELVDLLSMLAREYGMREVIAYYLQEDEQDEY